LFDHTPQQAGTILGTQKVTMDSSSKTHPNLDAIGWMHAIIRSYASYLRGPARDNESAALITLSDHVLDFVLNVNERLNAQFGLAPQPGATVQGKGIGQMLDGYADRED
jgi:hypothetical protein